MADSRPRQQRPRSLYFTSTDLSELLHAFGDPATSTYHRTHPRPAPLPSTISVLDELLVSFIIETCHAAAQSASYSRRQKIKVDDFKFVLRHDEKLLGRVLEQMWKERGIKQDRKLFDEAERAERVEELGNVAEMGGAGEEVVKKKGRRGRRKKREIEAEGAAAGGGAGKRMKVE